MIHPAHWHLILNHIPVVGSAFAFGLLAWAMARRSEELKRASLCAVVLVALLTVPAYLTGEPAFEGIMEILEATPEDEDPLVNAHQNAAGFSFAAAALAGVVAIVGLVRSRGGKPMSRPIVVTVAVLTMVTLGLMGWTANLGGAIRHPEIRSEANPAAGSNKPAH
jgi:uncharacterized membrane protein